ncbi:MAG: hypothetical protein KIS78_15910 [Labilithrix sp.]|nr:hypothetical protein [Labilithrix sp.]MCW5833887.1 hypothetical protein [Labilithrix sp.]
MTVPTVSCNNCGTNFTTDDLRGTSCRYCGTVLAHHARAAQQVAVVNQMLADRNGNGIPDAFEGLVANAQANAMHQAFGVNAFAHGPYGPTGQPPNMGAPPAPGVPPMMGAVVHAHHAHHAHAQAAQAINKAVILVVVAVIVVMLLLFGAGVAMYLFTAG